MFSLPSLVCHFLQENKKKEKTDKSRPVHHPFLDVQYQSPSFPKSAQFLDFQWTPQGLSGQFRGVLSGLKPLDWRCLLQVDDKKFVHELRLKKELMRADGPFVEAVTAGLDCRLDAQTELMELVLDNLRSYHQDTFTFTEEGLEVKPNNAAYRFSEWSSSPLLLLAELLQEDFIILEYDETDSCWRFASGTAAFSFVELGINGEAGFMKPGASMASIHTPVPGFNPTIHDQVSNYFRALKGDNAFWRANWIITPLEGISPFEEEISGDKTSVERSRIEPGATGDKTAELTKAPLLSPQQLHRPPRELAIRTEHQTVFKLGRSGCLVFAVHSYIDCLEDLAVAPRAAEMVARATLEMNSHTLKYRGIDTETREVIVEYIKSLY